MELVLQSSATNNKSELALALNMFLISDTSGNFTSNRVRGVQYLWQRRWPAMPHHKGLKYLMLYDPLLS